MRSAASLLLAALVLGLLAGAWVPYRAARNEAAAEAAYPPEGRIVEVDGRRVHAVTRGTGPDLVLIHGASGHVRDMTFRFMDRLTDRYRVTAFDRPGHGYSDPLVDGAESPEDQARILQAAARALGIESPIVLGHSYGGAVALAWALSDPDGTAAVVSVAGVAMPWPGGLGWRYELFLSRLGEQIVPPLVAAFSPDWIVDAALTAVFAPDPVPDGYADHFGTGLTLRRQSLRINAQQVNALRPHVVAMSERYASLTMPIEIVHGEADTIVPAHVHSIPFAALVPSANLELLPDTGHAPHHTEPDAVVAAIDRARQRAGL